MRTRGLLACSVILTSFFHPGPATAQYISVRTVPLITSGQADPVPSVAQGMGNLSFVYDDPFASCFVHPAKARAMGPLTLFLSPGRSGWTNDYGPQVSTSRGSSKYVASAVQTLPVGILFHAANLFGGGSITYQDVKGERLNRTPGDSWWGRAQPHDDVGSNRSYTGLLGFEIPALHLALGGGVSWSTIGAVDGVSLLYPGSYEVRQSGWALDYRVGLLGDLGDGDRIELLAARGRLSAAHDVFYPWPTWNEGTRSYLPYTRELNEDKTDQWAATAVGKKALSGRWTLAALAGINRKEHPKLPNYDLANIPRDPGNSSAYHLGLGLLYADSLKCWGWEYVYEPIRSETWAEAGDLWGPRFLPWFRTVENTFRFHNHLARIGHQARSGLAWLDYRFGAQLHFFHYTLGQTDNIRQSTRSMDLSWTETLLSAGLTARLGGFRLLYTLQVVLGNGTPGVAASTRPIIMIDDMERAVSAAFSSDFLVAPSGDVTVDQITLVSHQLSLVYTP